jgi:hypothetical protein
MADHPALSREELQEAIRQGREMAHRREYETALATMGRTGSDWSELSEAERARIMAENHRYWAEVAEFGRSLGAAPR